MGSEVQREMPRYQSHKEVHALKLRRVTFVDPTGEVLFLPADNQYAEIRHDIRDEVAKRCRSQQMQDPGYYVVYPDGFTSWSPTEAFESGYTAL